MNFPPLANLGCLGSLINSAEFIEASEAFQIKKYVVAAKLLVRKKAKWIE